METFNRYRLMLKIIPRLPKRIAVKEIMARLDAAGCSRVSERNVQRDLEKLSHILPITCDDRKPKGWSWTEEAMIDLPGMDPETALTFRLVERFMLQMLPPSCLKSMKPHFKAADKVLDKTNWDSLNMWPEKLMILTRSQPLLSPKIPGNVLDVVYESLFTQKKFEATYLPRGKDPKEYEVNPLGLVFVDNVLYLVCTLWDYDDIKQFALHRFTAAECLDKPLRSLQGFSLSEYVATHQFEYPLHDGIFQLEALFDADACYHLHETPLSEDQTISTFKDGRMQIKATVSDTHQLRWWLLSFGKNVEVLRPKKLRSEMRQIAHDMAEQYKKA